MDADAISRKRSGHVTRRAHASTARLPSRASGAAAEGPAALLGISRRTPTTNGSPRSFTPSVSALCLSILACTLGAVPGGVRRRMGDWLVPPCWLGSMATVLQAHLPGKYAHPLQPDASAVLRMCACRCGRSTDSTLSTAVTRRARSLRRRPLVMRPRRLRRPCWLNGIRLKVAVGVIGFVAC